MKKNKKFLALALGTVLSLSMLAGCGNSGETTEAPAADDSSAETEAPAAEESSEAAEAPADGGGRFRLLAEL